MFFTYEWYYDQKITKEINNFLQKKNAVDFYNKVNIETNETNNLVQNQNDIILR